MVNVFFSYSHKDEDLRNELESHLAALKRQGVIRTWHDRRITAGDEFADRDKDKFLEDAFEYMAKFFEGSLGELGQRNPGVEGNFRRIGANRFIATVYVGGEALSRCKISCGGRRSFMSGITYSISDSLDDNDFNEQCFR